ncbi:hypothetical protein HK102_000487 [Quaeritorhiza haematococci]|nr:hypothetical protein HK102_000487 [Quaeritorhiza haematococci]
MGIAQQNSYKQQAPTKDWFEDSMWDRFDIGKGTTEHHNQYQQPNPDRKTIEEFVTALSEMEQRVAYEGQRNLTARIPASASHPQPSSRSQQPARLPRNRTMVVKDEIFDAYGYPSDVYQDVMARNNNVAVPDNSISTANMRQNSRPSRREHDRQDRHDRHDATSKPAAAPVLNVPRMLVVEQAGGTKLIHIPTRGTSLANAPAPPAADKKSSSSNQTSTWPGQGRRRRKMW